MSLILNALPSTRFILSLNSQLVPLTVSLIHLTCLSYKFVVDAGPLTIIPAPSAVASVRCATLPILTSVAPSA